MNSKLHIFMMSTILSGAVSAAAVDGRYFEYQGKVYSYDEAMRSDRPPEGFEVVEGVDDCSERVEEVLGVGYRVFELIHLVEGGRSGMATFSTSDDGQYTSWDIGRYQINEINWPAYNGMLTPFDLRWNDCANLVAAAYRVKPFVAKAMSYSKRAYAMKEDPVVMLDRVLYLLAGYNSESEEQRERYKARLHSHLVRYILEGKIVSLW